uniref:RBR-type E3 ubiquitin transferase n=1 Tax=Ananas comosus var. bracteatus TaxID=296719 RepID=A0A6V7NG35_ANACO|nr:unnamed protein product [Ananas comosus var. bracteatus]
MDDAEELDHVVSDQHREFMAARSAESDLDLAFRLQMEEAMAASLALLPSSSASASAAAAPSSSSAVAIAGKGEGDGGDLVFVLGLQALELERFRQERKDSEETQAERRRVADDLRRRAHDGRFAHDILMMPDEEWDEFGDDFERPMWPGPGPGAAATARRRSRSGSTSRGWRKPMPAEATSREMLETKALIEGLNAAISLGIKRINVFSDYKVLYNHLTGKWIVRQRKVANTINQVSLLQRKFEGYRMFLLPRNHVKYVFKFAKDVIDSQITKKADVSPSKNTKETCIICLEATDSSEMFAVDGCSHHFCFSCMKQHAEVKLLHGMLPSCPHDGCNMKLNVESSRKFLSPKLLEIMTQRIKEESIPAAEKVYCPNPKCSALMSLDEAMRPQQESSSSKKPFVDTSGLRVCIKCNGPFCIKCKVLWHDQMSCYDYKRLHPHPRPEDAKLQSLARQKLWRQCTKCNNMIELAEGCFHMTCRCGHEFCYTCGKEWKDKRATCSCPLWEEGNILYDDTEDEDDDEDFFNDEDEDEDDEYDFHGWHHITDHNRVYYGNNYNNYDRRRY